MAKGDNGKTDESKTLMNGRAKAVKEPIFYNRQKGTVLGRDLKAWGKLLGFYTIFYIFLAAFWIGCLAIFLKTIDPNIPKYYGKGTIIGVNPGVGFQPLPTLDSKTPQIRFNVTDPESYAIYVQTLETYLAKYANTNNTRTCTGSESNSDIVENGKVASNTSAACRFDLKIFDSRGCGAANKYGYVDGKPCVILSLNRLIGWKPEEFASDEVPANVKSRYKKGSIAFQCDGAGQSDKDNLGKVEYLPDHGIDGRFYPYAVMANYHQPIAMAKFSGLPVNRSVIVQCRAYTKNIEQDVITGLGLVTFELFRVA